MSADKELVFTLFAHFSSNVELRVPSLGDCERVAVTSLCAEPALCQRPFELFQKGAAGHFPNDDAHELVFVRHQKHVRAITQSRGRADR